MSGPSRARLERSRIGVSGRLIDALRCLEESASRIVLAVDSEERLVGVLTDGDIRRALIAGSSLETRIGGLVRREYTAVGPEAGRAEVLDLMQARSISAIPVVGRDGRLLGLHLLHELLGRIERPNWAVIMAGGEGRRLRPLTESMPKPMLRVAGRPILERLVLHLLGFGIRRIFISVNHLAGVIEEHFGNGGRFGCSIEYLRETQPLGTGGPLSLLPDEAQHPLLVVNGDIVTQADLGALIEFHAEGGQRLTLGVRRYFHTIPFGCVELEGSRVARLLEKPQIARVINAGIYVLDPDLPRRVPANQAFPITLLIEQLLACGESVRAFEIQEDWVDVGQREELQRAQGRA